MMPAPAAALFDMDGVLVPNAPFHLKAWFVFAERYGLALTKDDYIHHMNGRTPSDSLAFLFRHPLTAADSGRYAEEKEAIYRELYQPYLAPTPGLIPFLDALKSHNVRIAVGTSAVVSNVNFTLDGLHIRPYFDTIVDATMVKHGKPNPEIYLKAAEHLGVPANRCVVFEDAFAGIESGHRAGMPVVALATTHKRQALTSTSASLIIDDFTQLNVAVLLALTGDGVSK